MSNLTLYKQADDLHEKLLRRLLQSRSDLDKTLIKQTTKWSALSYRVNRLKTLVDKSERRVERRLERV